MVQTFDNIGPAETALPTKAQKVTGWVLWAIVVPFLAFDACIHLFPPAEVVKLSSDMGLNQTFLTQIGVIMVACLTLYVIPRTAILGAVLLTGYLGGAVATQLRLPGGSWLFAVIIGVLVWSSLWLRDTRVRKLI